MPYVTIMQPERRQQITLEQILAGEVKVVPRMNRTQITGTITRKYPRTTDEMIMQFSLPRLTRLLKEFCQRHGELYSAKRESLYSTFFIPKRSGGLRRIDAPNSELKEALRELSSIFTDEFGALYHTSAFAYVKGRSTMDSARKHVQNQSHWYLKMDFSNFFGSTTLAFVMEQLSHIFPFSELVKLPDGKEVLEKALDLCFLNGGLPQGTPISPMLTNLMMIPFDHTIANILWSKGFAYTRYADDLTISHRYSFKANEIEAIIREELERLHAPFKVNSKKTHYGSNAGRNWHLGLMINSDNEITIGHKKKKQFKSMLNNYLTDRAAGKRWEISDVYTLQGLLSYYRSIEGDDIDGIVRVYNQKFGSDAEALMREDIRRGV